MANVDLIKKAVESAAKVAVDEAKAISRLEEVIRSESFATALTLCLDCDGIIYILGMGKSGLVGQKISATLTSAGSASIYIHAGDALHGDLGSIRKGDVAILISKSGMTREVNQIIPFLQDQQNPIIAITNDESSSLAREAHVTLPMKVETEACPMNLAPMTSTTATMALGDALAAGLIVAKDFKPEDFARFHPGGKLGWMLTAKVANIMYSGAHHALGKNNSLRDAVTALVESRAGAVNIVHDDGTLAGVLTDGDLKRIISSEDGRSLDQPVERFMTANPTTIHILASAAQAVELMENRDSQIYVLPVVDDEKKPVGMLRLHDVIKSHM